MLLIAVLLILTGIFFEDTPFRKDALGFIVVDLEFIVGEPVVNFV